ncbi:metallophosphoesterase [Vagococcus elongatus]|nr:metallophosphoesterase [Vagococcus elongatus]
MSNFIPITLIFLVVIILEGVRENRVLSVAEHKITSVKQSSLKIAQLSDLQYPRLRINEDTLIEELKKGQPDLIFLTGDTIDRTESVKQTKLKTLLPKLTAIAPVFIVAGNHETTSGQYDEWRQMIDASDAILLENEIQELEINGYQIAVGGLCEYQIAFPQEQLDKLKDKQQFLLLSHHPEIFESIIELLPKNETFDTYIFSGHAHGGQIIIPGIGGLLSPNQGLFPKITDGIYDSEQTQQAKLIVSRGLANSRFPLRINNYPQLNFLTIE